MTPSRETPSSANRVKYFVAHLLSGRAKTYHERLTSELSKRFHILPLHERVPPHLTFKIPFEADSEGILHVERVVRSFAHLRARVPLSLEGFGHFGFKTIYLNTTREREAITLMRDLLKALHDSCPWLRVAPLEGNKLHASVARFLTRRKFLRIWRHVKPLKPRFDIEIDQLVILERGEHGWKVRASIPFLGSGTSYVPAYSASSEAQVLY